jgi:Collagen triple helix repeat (20 copies)
VRKRITYANVAATLALVFAMSGGAFAAKHYLLSSTKQISPKVLKALKGKTGKTGATGPAGPAGLTGKEGLSGKEGKEGKEGKQGPPGPVSLTKLEEVRTEPPVKVKEEEGFASAFCPEGTTAVSGGYFVTGLGLLGTRSESFNFFFFGIHFTGWSVAGTNISGEVELEAIAYCAKEGAAVVGSRISPAQRRLAEKEINAKLRERGRTR